MHIFNASSTPELHTGAIHLITIYNVGLHDIYENCNSHTTSASIPFPPLKYCFTPKNWFTNTFINTEIIKLSVTHYKTFYEVQELKAKENTTCHIQIDF
jgi:hypothetical protein